MVYSRKPKLCKSRLTWEATRSLGYKHYWFSAQKKGYSGAAILSKSTPKHIEYGTGIDHMDFEGRVIRADYDQCSVISLYLPSGTNDRLTHKFKFMDDFKAYIDTLKKDFPNSLFVGITIFVIRPLTFMTQLGIKMSLVFSPKNALG